MVFLEVDAVAVIELYAVTLGEAGEVPIGFLHSLVSAFDSA